MSTQGQSHEDVFKLKSHECIDCDNTFDSKGGALDHYFNSHVDIDSLPAQFKCTICDSAFDSRDSFRSHSEDHKIGEVIPSCKYCSNEFNSRSNLKMHIFDQHIRDSDLFTSGCACPICDVVGENGHSIYMNHVRHNHSSDELFSDDRVCGECPECEDVLSDEDGMFQHFAAKHASDTVEVGYECELCDEVFLNMDDIENHIAEDHNPSKLDDSYIRFSCPHCSSLEQTKSDLEDHFDSYHNKPLVVCPECSETFDCEDKQTEHYWFNHGSQKSCESTVVQTVPKQDTLEYLYNINKHAKKYKQLGSENYRKGKKTTAKANSLKKEALYGIKENVLQEIYEVADTIEIHIIDSHRFYFIDFGLYNFHAPIENLSVPDEYVEEEKKLQNFHSGSEKEKSSATLKSSLQFFNKAFNENANEHLNRTHLSYGHRRYFIGWKYLSSE